MKKDSKKQISGLVYAPVIVGMIASLAIVSLVSGCNAARQEVRQDVRVESRVDTRTDSRTGNRMDRRHDELTD